MDLFLSSKVSRRKRSYITRQTVICTIVMATNLCFLL